MIGTWFCTLNTFTNLIDFLIMVGEKFFFVLSHTLVVDLVFVPFTSMFIWRVMGAKKLLHQILIIGLFRAFLPLCSLQNTFGVPSEEIFHLMFDPLVHLSVSLEMFVE